MALLLFTFKKTNPGQTGAHNSKCAGLTQYRPLSRNEAPHAITHHSPYLQDLNHLRHLSPAGAELTEHIGDTLPPEGMM